MLTVALACALALQPAPERKVLVIGIDGCRPDALAVAATPQIDRLASEGCSRTARADRLAVSGPCWSSVLCGVWAGKHGVRDNGFGGSNYAEYPDFVTLLERVRPELRTVVVTSWRPIAEKIVQTADYEGPKRGDGDDVVAIETADLVSKTDPDVVFVHFDAIDHAGHTYGYGPEVKEYVKAIEEVDSNIGTILEAVRARLSYKREDWLVVVTSDHGGTGKGHGLPISEHTDVPFIVSGPSAARTIPIVPTQVDVAPTVFAFLGLKPPVNVDWDGVPVGLAAVDSEAEVKRRDAGTVRIGPAERFGVGEAAVEFSVEEPGLEVRSTIDGTLPTATSELGVRRTIRSDMLVRARAFKDGRPIGPSSFARFVVQPSTLQAVSGEGHSPGLGFVVVEGDFTSVGEADFSHPLRSGFASRPSHRAAGIGTGFAVKFKGYVQVPATGIYRFGLYCDDGAKLWIGGRLVVDHDGLHSASLESAKVSLEQGWHALRLVYFQASGDATLSLWYGKGDEALVEVAASQLAHKG